MAKESSSMLPHYSVQTKTSSDIAYLGNLDGLASKLAQFEIEPTNGLVSVCL